MHYLQRGTGDPVVLIHGFPETSYSWRHQLAALSEHYAVFAPDTRGFGQTDKPGTRVTRQILAQDVINFMDALGIERAAIVGHDWGGIIAFKLAIDWPHRVTRLALLDTLCTVWPRLAQHGYWFKAEPYPEEFFAKYHRGFIETVITGKSSMTMPWRPESRGTIYLRRFDRGLVPTTLSITRELSPIQLHMRTRYRTTGTRCRFILCTRIPLPLTASVSNI